MSHPPRDRTAERVAIVAAAERLVAGTPLHSTTGKLTQTELISESRLRRDVVYEHRDLIDAFKAQVKAQHDIPCAMQVVIDQRDQLAAQIAGIKVELAREREMTAALRRLAAELSLELDQARQDLATTATVTHLPTRRTGPRP
jgi:hypothetical protein